MKVTFNMKQVEKLIRTDIVNRVDHNHHTFRSDTGLLPLHREYSIFELVRLDEYDITIDTNMPDQITVTYSVTLFYQPTRFQWTQPSNTDIITLSFTAPVDQLR